MQQISSVCHIQKQIFVLCVCSWAQSLLLPLAIVSEYAGKLTAYLRRATRDQHTNRRNRHRQFMGLEPAGWTFAAIETKIPVRRNKHGASDYSIPPLNRTVDVKKGRVGLAMLNDSGPQSNIWANNHMKNKHFTFFHDFQLLSTFHVLPWLPTSLCRTFAGSREARQM